MSTRRSTSTRDAADVATTEEAQSQEVSGGSSQNLYQDVDDGGLCAFGAQFKLFWCLL